MPQIALIIAVLQMMSVKVLPGSGVIRWIRLIDPHTSHPATWTPVPTDLDGQGCELLNSANRERRV